jgi:hypothetical protein
MANAFEKAKRKSLRKRWEAGEVSVEHWFERDRRFVGIQEVDSGEYLAEWWDDEVGELIEGGFFYSPGIAFRMPAELAKFNKSVMDYAESQGIKAYRGRAK